MTKNVPKGTQEKGYCVVKKIYRDIRLRLVKALNVLLMAVPLGFCWYLFYAEEILLPFYRRGNWAMIVLFVVLYLLFTRVYDALRISTGRISEMVYSQGLSLLMADGILFLVLWLLMRRWPNILPALGTLAVQLVLTALWSLFAHKWYFLCSRQRPPRWYTESGEVWSC